MTRILPRLTAPLPTPTPNATKSPDATKSPGLEVAAERAPIANELVAKKPLARPASGSEELPPPITEKVREERSVTIGDTSLRRGDRAWWTPAPGAAPVLVELALIRGEKVTVAPVGAPPSTRVELALAEGGAPLTAVSRAQQPATVDLEATPPVIRVAGQRIAVGDAVRFDYWAGEDYYADRTAQIRAISASPDGKPRVVIDEHVYPGRTRTRALDLRELESGGRADYHRSWIRSFLRPIPEGVVVRHGEDGVNTFRRGADDFVKGDRVLVDGEHGARIVSLRAHDGGKPRVMVRYDDGRAETLDGSALARLSLDRTALAARKPESSPWPGIEVARPEGAAPIALIDGEAHSPGEVIRFDRGTPGDFPMVIDRIDADDRVWITELVPLGAGEKTLHEVEVGGKAFRAYAAGPFEAVTRPIEQHERNLFHAMPRTEELKYKTFDYQDLGWALDRARTGRFDTHTNELFVRGAVLGVGDRVDLVRGGVEERLTITGLLDGERVSVKTESGAERIFERSDLPFLRAIPAPAVQIDGVPVEPVPNGVLAKAGAALGVDVAERSVSPRALTAALADAGASERFLRGLTGIAKGELRAVDPDWVCATTAELLGPGRGPASRELANMVAASATHLFALDDGERKALVGLGAQFGRIRMLIG